jgi:hypothetical protein
VCEHPESEYTNGVYESTSVRLWQPRRACPSRALGMGMMTSQPRAAAVTGLRGRLPKGRSGPLGLAPSALAGTPGARSGRLPGSVCAVGRDRAGWAPFIVLLWGLPCRVVQGGAAVEYPKY